MVKKGKTSPWLSLRGDPVERFWVRVKKTRGCWIWIGGTNKQGYGHLTVGGRMTKVHRFAYELLIGPIPKGMHVLHSCDNSRCVRPEHLFLGTNADNVADKLAKGRQIKGEQQYGAKLTAAKVALARRLRKNGESVSVLARRYEVCERTMAQALQGRTWKFISEEPVKPGRIRP